MKLPAPMAAFALGVALLPVHAGILFSDNFDSGASSAWGDQRGNWRAVNGTYDATAPSNSPVTYTDVTTLTNLTDFTVNVDVNDWNDGGVWLRSNYNGGAIDGVVLITGGGTGTNQGFYWHVVQNGVFSGILNSTAIPGIQGTNQHLSITVAGNEYTACVASVCNTLATSAFISGSTGLYDFSPQNTASTPRGETFDNFKVSSVPEPRSAYLFGLGLIALVAGPVKRAKDRRYCTHDQVK